jgi:hypothetical protein
MIVEGIRGKKNGQREIVGKTLISNRLSEGSREIPIKLAIGRKRNTRQSKNRASNLSLLDTKGIFLYLTRSISKEGGYVLYWATIKLLFARGVGR